MMHLPYWCFNLLPSQFGAVKTSVISLTVYNAWFLVKGRYFFPTWAFWGSALIKDFAAMALWGQPALIHWTLVKKCVSYLATQQAPLRCHSSSTWNTTELKQHLQGPLLCTACPLLLAQMFTGRRVGARESWTDGTSQVSLQWEPRWKPASLSQHFTASLTVVKAATLAGLAQNLCTHGVCWAQSHFIAVFRAELYLDVGCLEVLSEHCALLCEAILTIFFFSCLLFQEPGLYCCGNADRETTLGRVRSHGSHFQNRHPTNQPPAPLSHIRTLPGLSKADLCGSQAQTLCWRAAQTSVCTAPVLNYLPC